MAKTHFRPQRSHKPAGGQRHRNHHRLRDQHHGGNLHVAAAELLM